MTHCDLCNQTEKHFALNKRLCTYHYCTLRGFNRCSNCDKKFKQLKKCYICKNMAMTREHHISYLPQIVMNVCTGCHNKIHRGSLKQFLPNRRMQLIFYARKGGISLRTKKGWYYRKLTDFEKEIRKQMKKSKVMLE